MSNNLKEALKKLNVSEIQFLNNLLSEQDFKKGDKVQISFKSDPTMGEIVGTVEDEVNGAGGKKMYDVKFSKEVNWGGKGSKIKGGKFYADELILDKKNTIKEEVTVSNSIVDKLLMQKLNEIEGRFITELNKMAEKQPQIRLWTNQFGKSFKTIPELIRGIRQEKKIWADKPIKNKLNKLISDYYKDLQKLYENKNITNSAKLLSEHKGLLFEQLYNTIKDQGIVFGKFKGKNVVGIHFHKDASSLFELFDLDSSRIDNRNSDFVLFDKLPEGNRYKYELSVGEESVKGQDFAIYPSKFMREGEDGSVVKRTVSDRKEDQFTLAKNKYEDIKKSFGAIKESLLKEDEGKKDKEEDEPKSKEEKKPELDKKSETIPVKSKKTGEMIDVPVDQIGVQTVVADLLKSMEGEVSPNASSTLDIKGSMGRSAIEKYLSMTQEDVKKLSNHELADMLSDVVPMLKWLDEQSKVYKDLFDKMGDAVLRERLDLVGDAVLKYRKILVWVIRVQDKKETDWKTVVESLMKVKPELEVIVNSMIEKNTKVKAGISKLMKSMEGEKYAPKVTGKDAKPVVNVVDHTIKEGRVNDYFSVLWNRLSEKSRTKLHDIYYQLFVSVESSIVKLSKELKSISSTLGSNPIKQTQKSPEIKKPEISKESINHYLWNRVLDEAAAEKKTKEDDDKKSKEDVAVKDTNRNTKVLTPQQPVEKKPQPQQKAEKPVPIETPQPQAEPKLNAPEQPEETPPKIGEEPAQVSGEEQTGIPEKQPETDTGEDMDVKQAKADEQQAKKKQFVLVTMDETGKFQGISAVLSTMMDARNKQEEFEKAGQFIKIYTVTEGTLKRVFGKILKGNR